MLNADVAWSDGVGMFDIKLEYYDELTTTWSTIGFITINSAKPITLEIKPGVIKGIHFSWM